MKFFKREGLGNNLESILTQGKSMAPYFKGWALRVEEEGFRNRSEKTVRWAEGLGGEKGMGILSERRVARLLGGDWHLPSAPDTAGPCLKRAQAPLPPQYKLGLRT